MKMDEMDEINMMISSDIVVVWSSFRVNCKDRYIVHDNDQTNTITITIHHPGNPPRALTSFLPLQRRVFFPY
jgi:hypothetical protein